MKWVKGHPTRVGWYWQRRLTGPEKGEVRIVQIRLFCSKLAIHNSNLSAIDDTMYEWAGPIPEPED